MVLIMKIFVAVVVIAASSRWGARGRQGKARRKARGTAAKKKQSKESSSKDQPGSTALQGKSSSFSGQRTSGTKPASGSRIRTSLVTDLARRVIYERTARIRRVRQKAVGSDGENLESDT